MSLKIAIASDHAGYQVEDFGTHSEEPVDYPLFIRPAAEAVAHGDRRLMAVR